MIHEKKVVTYYSDVTGEEVEKVVPISVKKGNRSYVIDVDANNVDEELANITVYDAIKKGQTRHNKSRAEFHAKVRQWAYDNGVPVGKRGNVPKAVVQQYWEAQEKLAANDPDRPARTEAELEDMKLRYE